jgi:hypothetical protein
MDIIVKGAEDTMDPDLPGLPQGQESYVWRSPRPVYANIGDRVYFARTGGEIFLYATYAGYAQREGINNQGARPEWGCDSLDPTSNNHRSAHPNF